MNNMKYLLCLICSFMVVAFTVTSCQRSYIDEPMDIATSTIEFKNLTVSRDSACMFDTILIVADAVGDNLKYEWQRAKGTLIPVKGEPYKAYFWGCYTCVGKLTVACTVSNDFGSYTKYVDVFVWPWTKQEGRFPGWEILVDDF